MIGVGGASAGGRDIRGVVLEYHDDGGDEELYLISGVVGGRVDLAGG